MITIYFMTMNGVPAYVGQTINMKNRWAQHLERSDFRPDGIAALEVCDGIDEANAMEQKWIGLMRLSFDIWNKIDGGIGCGRLGGVNSPEHRARQRAAALKQHSDPRAKIHAAVTSPEFRAKSKIFQVEYSRTSIGRSQRSMAAKIRWANRGRAA